ncbi:hypothetical protein [Clavibacter capsici]|uniref:hypothetical protein n=1 Tax=Clavibacter capsici TaxID=1874630 RepID=UPI00287B835D|nr:hypothetical protein [Clavibacter capsici]
MPRVPVAGAGVAPGTDARSRPLTLDELFPPEAAAAGTATPGAPMPPVSPHRTAAARGAAAAARRARDDRPAGS